MTERELIRDIKKQVTGYGCTCDVARPELCNQCVLLKMIDDGLAEIGEGQDCRDGGAEAYLP